MVPLLDAFLKHQPQTRTVIRYLDDNIKYLLTHVGVVKNGSIVLEVLEISLVSFYFLGIIERSNNKLWFNTFLFYIIRVMVLDNMCLQVVVLSKLLLANRAHQLLILFNMIDCFPNSLDMDLFVMFFEVVLR